MLITHEGKKIRNNFWLHYCRRKFLNIIKNVLTFTVTKRRMIILLLDLIHVSCGPLHFITFSHAQAWLRIIVVPCHLWLSPWLEMFCFCSVMQSNVWTKGQDFLSWPHVNPYVLLILKSPYNSWLSAMAS